MYKQAIFNFYGQIRFGVFLAHKEFLQMSVRITGEKSTRSITSEFATNISTRALQCTQTPPYVIVRRAREAVNI